MTRLLFIRHGQSEFNLTRRFAGNSDAALTELGLRQAAATADYIASAYAVDAVYASDLQRAFCTGKAVADRLGLPVRPHKGLREIFAGEWEGQHFDHLEAAYPETFAGLWRKDIGNSVCDGGESVAQLMQRILATVREIAEANPGKTVVLATHATPIRCMECFCQGNDLSRMKDIPWVTNASVTEIHYENGVFTEIISSYSQHLTNMVSTLPANV